MLSSSEHNREVFAVGDFASVTVPKLGVIADNRAFYRRSNSGFGSDAQVLKIGYTPYFLKMEYRNLFYMQHGQVLEWDLVFAEMLEEKVLG